jgi:hypothetical protein
MIYFIQCGNDGPIKIGYTDRETNIRMAAMQVCCPYELKIIGLMEGSYSEEQELHKIFKYHRIRGEWFSNTREIINYLNGEHKLTFTKLCELEPRLFDLFHDVLVYVKTHPNEDHLERWLMYYKKKMCKLVGWGRKYDDCDSRLVTSEAYNIAYQALTHFMYWGGFEYELDSDGRVFHISESYPYERPLKLTDQEKEEVGMFTGKDSDFMAISLREIIESEI